MRFESGDRVRIRKPQSEYTGCRGTIADDPALRSAGTGVMPLGHFVAIDGENGVTRPFLIHELEPLRPAVVRRGESVCERASAVASNPGKRGNG